MVNKLGKNPTKILHPQTILLGFFGFPLISKTLDAILVTVRWFLVSSVPLLLTVGFLVLCSSVSIIKQRTLPLDSLPGLVCFVLI